MGPKCRVGSCPGGSGQDARDASARGQKVGTTRRDLLRRGPHRVLQSFAGVRDQGRENALAREALTRWRKEEASSPSEGHRPVIRDMWLIRPQLPNVGRFARWANWRCICPNSPPLPAVPPSGRTCQQAVHALRSGHEHGASERTLT